MLLTVAVAAAFAGEQNFVLGTRILFAEEELIARQLLDLVLN